MEDLNIRELAGDLQAVVREIDDPTGAPEIVATLSRALRLSATDTPRNALRRLLKRSAYALLSEAREEAERERDELRLAITGGEDAPGHNASLSHETILGVLAENYRSWRAASDRWVAAETRAQQLEKALREINRCASPDGSRTMDDMIRALDWITAHARQALQQGEGNG